MSKHFLSVFFLGISFIFFFSIAASEGKFNKKIFYPGFFAFTIFSINTFRNKENSLYIPFVSALKSLYERKSTFKYNVLFSSLKKLPDDEINNYVKDVHKNNNIDIVLDEGYSKENLIKYLQENRSLFKDILKKCALQDQLEAIERSNQYSDENKIHERHKIEEKDICKKDDVPEGKKNSCFKQRILCQMLEDINKKEGLPEDIQNIIDTVKFDDRLFLFLNFLEIFAEIFFIYYCIKNTIITNSVS